MNETTYDGKRWILPSSNKANRRICKGSSPGSSTSTPNHIHTRVISPKMATKKLSSPKNISEISVNDMFTSLRAKNKPLRNVRPIRKESSFCDNDSYLNADVE